ncbi:ankyrin repeat and MYND domain-containing protein 1 isoform X2 [Balaenoptera ricei]|uniref:ankyrin repeat and MYND domain-containing protein 1 isoform X2 n=1 Tax=Balaenoptera ricei TaxID=2746895 RepID=UPI0028BE512D|nr:ankyrin repeat and MYND domain-containing protein 1 isoform X2 [Balaenoptera ricei]
MAAQVGSRFEDERHGRSLSSISYYEIPNAGNSENQVEEGGSVPAAAGTPESSMLGTKRFIPEAPEGEEEEPEGPLREQDLKEAYIELIRGVQEWQDGCVYRGEFGLDVKLGCGEFSWPTGELCYECGRCVGVRLTPCTRCYGILTCSEYRETKAWSDFHRRDCHSLTAIDGGLVSR